MSAAKKSLRPSNPVAYGAAGGSPLGVLLVWALGLAGIEVSQEVAAALGTTVGALVGYFTKGGRVDALG